MTRFLISSGLINAFPLLRNLNFNSVTRIGSSFCLCLAAFALIFAASSCANHRFKVKGEIYGAENKTMVLEKPDFQGRWITIDSVHINRNGGFSVSFPAPMSPEIYRLSLNNQYIYIPVDSVETISLNTSYDKFGSDFSLSGSHNAEMMQNFEKELHKVDFSNADSVYSFKRGVYSKYLKDAPGSVMSFYILTKIVDGEPLYDPSDRQDAKYFSAVATGFKTSKPDDPRTALLEQTAINALKKRNAEDGNYLKIEAQEIAVIDIEQQDEDGNLVKLSDIVGKGKPVVVIFSLLNQPESPELNMALAKIYRDHQNVEFYNVSLDADQYAWRDAARNLPWVTVYSPGQALSQDAINYNVSQLPSFFIYDRNGELASRPLSLEQLNKAI